MNFLLNPFAGSINRGDWWFAQLIIFLMAVGVLVLMSLIGPTAFIPDDQVSEALKSEEKTYFVIVVLCVIYMNFATCVNRLRDQGKSGFYYTIFLLPSVGTGLMIYYCGIARGGLSTER